MDKLDAEKCLIDALDILKTVKPGDHSDQDRWYAILITDLEKLIAYYWSYIDE